MKLLFSTALAAAAWSGAAMAQAPDPNCSSTGAPDHHYVDIQGGPTQAPVFAALQSLANPPAADAWLTITNCERGTFVVGTGAEARTYAMTGKDHQTIERQLVQSAGPVGPKAYLSRFQLVRTGQPPVSFYGLVLMDASGQTAVKQLYQGMPPDARLLEHFQLALLGSPTLFGRSAGGEIISPINPVGVATTRVGCSSGPFGDPRPVASPQSGFALLAAPTMTMQYAGMAAQGTNCSRGEITARGITWYLAGENDDPVPRRFLPVTGVDGPAAYLAAIDIPPQAEGTVPANVKFHALVIVSHINGKMGLMRLYAGIPSNDTLLNDFKFLMDAGSPLITLDPTNGLIPLPTGGAIRIERSGTTATPTPPAAIP